MSYQEAYVPNKPGKKSGVPHQVADKKLQGNPWQTGRNYLSDGKVRNTKSMEAACVHEFGHIMHAEASPEMYWVLKGTKRVETDPITNERISGGYPEYVWNSDKVKECMGKEKFYEKDFLSKLVIRSIFQRST